MNPHLQKLYNKCPSAIQNNLLSAYAAHLHVERYGKVFREYKALMTELESASEVDVHDYQSRQLQRIVSHAYENVPYYRRLFDRIDLKPNDIQHSADLRHIPILTKENIRANRPILVAGNIPTRQLRTGHTSGTTGSPLELVYDANMLGMTYAAMDRQYRWADIDFRALGDRTAVLRGNMIVPLGQKDPPFWRCNRLHNQLLVSTFHLSPKNLVHISRELRRFKPLAIDGYPSALYILAKHLIRNDERLPLHAVLTSSETLYDFHREAIETAFSCRVFDYYGAAERVVFATECRKHNGKHLCPEYGITEVVDESGQPVEPGQEGVMVGTSLHNFAMPLLRYATNDRTALLPGACDCRAPFVRMQDITTKSEDLLHLRDGRVIPPSVLTHPFKPLDSIEGSQIHQVDLDHLVIKIVPRFDFSDADSRQLTSGLKSRLGQDIQIEVELVHSLPLTPSGKFKWVISDVKIGE